MARVSTGNLTRSKPRKTTKQRSHAGSGKKSTRGSRASKISARSGVPKCSRPSAPSLIDRARPAVLLLGILLCILIVAALFTYNPLDPSFTRASGSTVHNAAGPVGAWVADFGYQLLGYGAWSVVPLAVALSLVLARRSIGGLGALLGCLTVGWSLLGLVAAVWPAHPGVDFPAGGLVGEVSMQALHDVVGPAGTWIVLVGVALVALPFVVPVRFEDLAARLVGGMEGAAPHVGRAGRQIGRKAVEGVAAAGAAVVDRVRVARAEDREDRSGASLDDGSRWDEAGSIGDVAPQHVSAAVDSQDPLGPDRIVRPTAEAVIGDRATAWSDGGALLDLRPADGLGAGAARLQVGLVGAAKSSPPSVAPGVPTCASGRALVEAEWEPTQSPRDARDTVPAAEFARAQALEGQAVVSRTGDDAAVAAAESMSPVQRSDQPSLPWDLPEPGSLADPRPEADVDPGPRPASAAKMPRRAGRNAVSRHVAVTPAHLVSGGGDGGADLVADPALASFELPHLGLLDTHERDIARFNEIELQRLAQTLEGKLADFGVKGEVVAIRPGPVVTTFEFVPAPGIKLSKISGLSDDIAMALKALRVRIVAPIPGKGVVGIEIPNKKRQIVWLRDMLASDAFRKQRGALPMALGKTVEGKPYIGNLASMPHLLVGGTTGSGKSVGVNGMLLSMLYSRSPDELRLILIDPKMLEFELYRDIPHLLHPVVTEPKLASAALRWACTEMDERYRTLSRWGVRNIVSYNRKVASEREDWSVEKAWRYAPADWPGDEPPPPPKNMPYIVIVIDELADLMMVAAKDVEESIIRLAQKARAAGVHLIVATQRPSVNVITGLIKANMPSRVAFQVRTKVDGRTILDQNGAENLLGKGDQLFLPPGVSDLVRLHGPFCSDEEVRRVMDFLRDQGSPAYETEITADEQDGPEMKADDYDDLYDLALAYVCRQGKASSSMIQREFKIGYNRAARMLEVMEREGVVGPADGARPREILVASHAS